MTNHPLTQTLLSALLMHWLSRPLKDEGINPKKKPPLRNSRSKRPDDIKRK